MGTRDPRGPAPSSVPGHVTPPSPVDTRRCPTPTTGQQPHTAPNATCAETHGRGCSEGGAHPARQGFLSRGDPTVCRAGRKDTVPS